MIAESSNLSSFILPPLLHWPQNSVSLNLPTLFKGFSFKIWKLCSSSFVLRLLQCHASYVTHGERWGLGFASRQPEQTSENSLFFTNDVWRYTKRNTCDRLLFPHCTWFLFQFLMVLVGKCVTLEFYPFQGSISIACFCAGFLLTHLALICSGITLVG